MKQTLLLIDDVTIYNIKYSKIMTDRIGVMIDHRNASQNNLCNINQAPSYTAQLVGKFNETRRR